MSDNAVPVNPLSDNPADISKNIPGHKGLGMGNEDKIFLVDTAGPRLDLVKKALSEMLGWNVEGEDISVKSLMDYETADRPKGNLQGTYKIDLGEGHSFLLRVKKVSGPELIRVADNVFEHVERHVRENNQEGVLSLVRSAPFKDGEFVHKINGYAVNFTTFQDGRHIVSTPKEFEIKAIGAGLAVFRNGMDSLPEDLLSGIRKRSQDFAARTQKGLKFIRENRVEAFNLIAGKHGREGAKKILSLIEAFEAVCDKGAVASHGWLSDANMILTPENRLHIIDKELVAFSARPRGYDEGVAFSRAVLGKMEDPKPAFDRWAIDRFLKAYNEYAEQKLNPRDLAKMVNMGNVNAVLFGLASCADGDQESGEATIERHGQYVLDTDERFKRALNVPHGKGSSPHPYTPVGMG